MSKGHQARLPPEGKPYEIIWQKDPEDRDKPLVARVHTYSDGGE